MPTAAKLIAALCFAAVAFFTATLFIPALPEGADVRWFPPTSAVLGIIIGWRIMGRLVGNDFRGAARAGFYTSVWLLIWSLLAFSLREMLKRSLRKQYDSPVEALTNIIEISVHYFMLALSLEVLVTLAVGGMIAGILTELAHRYWH